MLLFPSSTIDMAVELWNPTLADNTFSGIPSALRLSRIFFPIFSRMIFLLYANFSEAGMSAVAITSFKSI